MEHRDRVVCTGVISHFDESETARTLSGTVDRDEYRYDFASLGEMIAELLFRSTVGDASDEQFRGHAFVAKPFLRKIVAA